MFCLHSGTPGHSTLQPRDAVGIHNILTDQNASEVLNYLANSAVSHTSLTSRMTWILNTRFVPMKINPQAGLMNPARNCSSSMYHVCLFHLLGNKKFMLLTRKHKHITLNSFYLQYPNTWQSPRKQHNSQLDVHNHKDKRMVGNELLWLCPAHIPHSSCEAKGTHQTLHLLLHAVTECHDV